jgi:hypothetical protein
VPPSEQPHAPFEQLPPQQSLSLEQVAPSDRHAEEPLLEPLSDPPLESRLAPELDPAPLLLEALPELEPDALSSTEPSGDEEELALGEEHANTRLAGRNHRAVRSEREGLSRRAFMRAVGSTDEIPGKPHGHVRWHRAWGGGCIAKIIQSIQFAPSDARHVVILTHRRW